MIDPKLFEVIANEVFMGISVFDQASGECLYLNQLGRETLGLTNLSQFTDLKLANLFPSESNSVLRPLSQFVLENEGYFQDILVSKNQADAFIADIGVKLFEQGNKKLIMLMFRDVTIQKKLQREVDLKQREIQSAFEEILNQNKALLELDKAKDRFVALTTHELRTPLSAVLAMADVLVNKLYDTPEQLDEFIKMIHSEGLHLMEIVNDILDMSKIKAGKMDLFVEVVEVGPIVSKLANSFQAMAKEKNVKIELTGNNNALACYADPLRLSQAFNNVLNNAIKFTRPNTTVRVEIRDSIDQVEILITDQGPGVPKGHEASVFNEFETISNVKTHHKGTGLGMPITKRILEALGGGISLESTENGAMFTLTLPKGKVLDESLYQTRPSSFTVDAA